MSLLHLVTLAIVQGITEFLPISSSAHLVLIPVLADWPDQGLAVDVAAHVGSLGAILLYFRRDIAGLAGGALALLRGRPHPEKRLVWLLAVATVPAVIAGAVLKDLAETAFRDPAVIGWTMVGGGILLFAADRLGATRRTVERMGILDAVWIGLAQVLALVPGTSRAGITMTMARALGFGRTEAARFSMLLAIPVIAGAGALTGAELAATGASLLTGDAAIAAALSFLAALAAVWLLMRWLARATFLPFVIYRLALGAVLLALFAV